MQKVEPGGMTSAVTSSLPTIHRPVKIKAPNEPPRAISRPSQNFLNAYPTSTSGLITSSRPHERHSKRPQLIKKRETSSRSMSATSYYLPTISKSSKTSSKSASTSWKSAQQVINKRIECEANGGEDEALSEDSGSDLSDFDGDSLISTLMSEISIDVNAASDNAIQLMGDSDSIPLLRAPPFPNLSSTLRFIYSDSVLLTRPERLPRLQWKNSSLTPRVVKKVVRNSHFEIVEGGKSWLGTFGKHLKPHNYKRLRSGQKVNHYPGCFVLGRKDRLWRTISRFIAKFGHAEYGFLPTTYILPKDRKLLKDAWLTNENFILKPSASARGIGIKILNKFDQVPKKRSVIVQKYIKNPLLINKLKWDLRIYVLVSSFSPLIAYIYDEGLVRFATDEFTTNSKRRFVHLTNYSVNKKSKKFQKNDDVDEAAGHKWSLKSLWPELDKLGYDTKQIWVDIKDIVLKTLIAAESHIVSQLHKNCASQKNCFELFGFDIMLDKKSKVHLIEVNVSPSLHSNSKLDEAIKGHLIADVFNTIGLTPFKPKPTPPITSDDRQANAKILMRTEMSNKEILQNLSRYHRHLVLKTEYERQRKGRLERLIPAPGVWKKYKRFFETARVDNIVLAAFEDEFGANQVKRRTGSEYLFTR